MSNLIPERFYNSFDFKSNILSEFSEGKLNLVMNELFENLEFKKGDKLFYEDGVPTGIFLLVNGKAKKYKSLFDGQQQIFYLYTSGDLMGHHALLSKERYQDSCELLEDSSVKFLSEKNFRFILEEYPELKSKLIENLAHEFSVMANLIGVLAQKSQSKRLGINLLILKNRIGDNDNGISIQRDDLSNLIGTSKESLSRSLKELKELDLIAIKKRVIYIKDDQKLFNYTL